MQRHNTSEYGSVRFTAKGLIPCIQEKEAPFIDSDEDTQPTDSTLNLPVTKTDKKSSTGSSSPSPILQPNPIGHDNNVIERSVDNYLSIDDLLDMTDV